MPALRHVPDGEGDRDADKPDAIFDNDYDDMDIKPEEDIVITIEEDAAVHNKLMRDKMAAQLRKRRKTTHGLLVGHHHGGLNPLPSTWEYPNEMNLIQMITLYQMGSPSESVPPLKLLKPADVCHFDKSGGNLSRMAQFMEVMKHYAVI